MKKIKYSNSRLLLNQKGFSLIELIIILVIIGIMIAASSSRLKDITSNARVGASINQITGDELKSNPHLAKGAAVSPPVIDNKVQTVQIGEGENIIDLQCCGGTHCQSTKEIGPLEIGKIENKGKRNRRINIRFSS